LLHGQPNLSIDNNNHYKLRGWAVKLGTEKITIEEIKDAAIDTLRVFWSDMVSFSYDSSVCASKVLKKAWNLADRKPEISNTSPERSNESSAHLER
jgi:hypothetical protein